MKEKRILAWALSLALLVGMLPGAAFAAEVGPPCEYSGEAEQTATDKRINWVSSNPAVAKVENGKVTALSNGKADITVTTTGGSDNSGPSYCWRTIRDRPTGVKVEGREIHGYAHLTVKAGGFTASGTQAVISCGRRTRPGGCSPSMTFPSPAGSWGK